MRTLASLVALLGLSILASCPASGVTLGASTPKNTRTLTVERTYEIAVVRGEKNVAAIPR